MFKLGLTGGIATGKSTVSNHFKELGIPVLDADVVAREVVEPGQPALADVVAEFGDEMLLPDGSLNRKALGAVVFGNPEKLAKLNQFTHPRVQASMRAQADAYAKAGVPLIVLDIPLLLEGKNAAGADAVMVVTVPADVQQERLMDRNQLSAEDARKRMNSQMPMAEKEQLADYVIDNSGTIAETYEQVDAVLAQLPH
ncbi:dephospho-CoA kinase [Weissella confusa]|uniref:Dephospho-CoA kinase n=1 Tax=Weissella confusa TaxID=1583 RepID=A0A4Z0RWC8_WEICO|nr:dephospho-CoA kinase [Weissella confusa]TGE72802.1 dephospho-CoA kinase [Weissella confusa]